jgi:hypothetical protein
MNMFEKSDDKPTVPSAEQIAAAAQAAIMRIGSQLADKKRSEEEFEEQRIKQEAELVVAQTKADEESLVVPEFNDNKQMVIKDLSAMPDSMLTARYLDLVAPYKISSPTCIVSPMRPYPRLVKFDLPPEVNFHELAADTMEALQVFGEWNYRLPDSNGVRKDMSYGGLGLTYNPNHLDAGTANVHEQVQGNHNPGSRGTKNPFSNFGVDQMPLIKKNSHYDTLGFVYRTPASRFKSLGKFLDSFPRTMVRTALRIIYAENEGPVGDGKYAGVTWHKDEAMTTNLRINIPIVTHTDYVLEQEGSYPIHLEAGYGYSWDTNVSHRAYARTRTAPPRIHLMLGFSCWWDFDEESGSWSTNEFAGKKHPMDMLYEGDILPGIKFRNV